MVGTGVLASNEETVNTPYTKLSDMSLPISL